jgi:hypothetical protein
VAIHSISRNHFTHCLPNHFHLDQLLGDEIEWFADDTDKVIGIVAQHHRHDWGYALLGQDAKGQFRVCDLKDHIEDHRTATIRLLRAMHASEQSRARVKLREKPKAK